LDAPLSGAIFFLRSLEMPDLDLIKQDEQAARPDVQPVRRFRATEAGTR
jgi:hypothetical protein